VHGIVYPIPVNVADISTLTNDKWNAAKMKVILDAADMSLLTYDPSILEQQERQSITDCLITTLDMVRRRYNVRELGYENLYAPAHYYLLWQILYLAIFVQRIQNIKTGNAHLYHIWNYLKSNGFEDYREVLTLRQQKFLYKNLPYLLKHKGTEHILEILDYVFFHTQNIALYGKNTIQTTGYSEITTTDSTKKYPTVRSIEVGKPMLDGVNENFGRHARFEDILHYIGQTAGQSIYNDREEYHYGTIEELPVLYQKEKEAKLEYQDESLFERSTTRHTKLLSYSPISHRNTKILELKNNKTVDYIQAIYTKFIGETILYRLSKENLDFIVEIQLPESAKRIELPIQDWIGVLFYALNRAGNNHADRPPNLVYVSWPYDLDMKDGEWTLPETFWWAERKCQTALNLASLVSTYRFGESIFRLSDDRQELQSTERYWTDDDGNILRFNHNTNRWNVVDKDENIISRSSKVYSASVNLSDLSWYGPGGSNRMIPLTKTYLVDLHMPRYNRKIRSAEEFAEMLHEQGLGFVIMNLDAMHDESAIHRAAYHMVMQHRCVGETLGEIVDINDPISQCRTVPIKLNLLNGMTYEDYFKQKSASLDSLNLVMSRYDVKPNPSILYSRMADEIIKSLLPEDDPYVPFNMKTLIYQHKKIVDLFKSMTAYNLAYIDMQYVDSDSTKMSSCVSANLVNRIRNSITDNFNNTMFEFKMSSIIKSTIKPQYPDQDNVILFSGDFDDTIKQSIINNIDKIITIYDTKRLSKSKKHNKLVTLLGEETTSIVEDMSYVHLQNIQNAVHLISKTHVYEYVDERTSFSEEQITLLEEDTDVNYTRLTIPDAEVVSNHE
jgi:hypothetical protein